MLMFQELNIGELTQGSMKDLQNNKMDTMHFFFQQKMGLIFRYFQIHLFTKAVQNDFLLF